MGLSGAKPQYIAVDTNVLLDRAEGQEDVIDCLETIKERVPSACFIILPSVIQELQDLSELQSSEIGGSDWKRKRRLAEKALDNILDWGFQPINYVPVGQGIAFQIARKLREKELLPPSEVNDSLIVAEAALMASTILLSNDSHILSIERDLLALELAAWDVTSPIIASPRQIVKSFFRKN